MKIKDLNSKLLAFAAVILLFGLIWLYTREFPVFTNTIGTGKLVLGSMIFGALISGGVLFGFRNRLSPAERHLPEIASTMVLSIVFMPLFASLINRAGGKVSHESFEFVSEKPYISSNYGVIKGEKIKPSGIRLIVQEQGKQHLFQYKQQEYFPLTEPGERVMLPMRKGLLGFRVLEIK